MISILNFFKNLFFADKRRPEPQQQAATATTDNLYKNIIAAKVVSVEKHPNADRLRVVRLSDGQHIIDPIVCGAFNFEAGDIVVLALPGANIPKNIHSETHEPFTLGKAKIRGIESQGMICAAFELGIGQLSDKPEIMILNETTIPGSEFSPAMIKNP